MFQAKAYIINLLILSLSFSDVAFADRAGGDFESGLPHLAPDVRRQIDEAYGQQSPFGQQFGGMTGIIPRFQDWAIKYPNLASKIPELNQRVMAVNDMALDEATRKKMFPGLISWIRDTLGDKDVNEDKLHSQYCVREGTFAETKPQGEKPTNQVSSPGESDGDSTFDTAVNANEAVSPVVRDRQVKAGVQITDVGEVAPTPPRVGWLARSFGEIPPTPARRRVVDAQGRPITGPESRYNGEGCLPSQNLTQTPPQGEADRNANNKNNGDSVGGSPTDENQPPQAGAGNASYSPKGNQLKAPNIPEGQPFGQLAAPAPINEACMFCSAIAEAGKSKYQYRGGETVKGIGEDIDRNKAQIEETLAKSGGFRPMQTMPNPRNQRPSTGDALSSAIKKGGAVNPLSLGPTL